MPRIERSATVVWEGNVARGEGRITAHTGAFADLPYSLPTRIAAKAEKTSPEELLAAAHAGCLTMGIATELTEAGSPPVHVELTCRIVMDEVEGQGHQIVGSRVEVVVRADGVEDGAFQDAVAKAHAGCPFSQLLERAGAEVSITARLA
jgi:lipoyl-dependent peroxiredoxin